jgi:glycosyltransferase involved in cell wall biosynthesis
VAATLIVIPAYNEGERVGGVIAGVRALGLDADILVVDDGSHDDTAAEAQRNGAKVLRHAYNLGYGSALLSGYVWSLRRGYERLVQLDGDGQHDPRDIPRLLDALEGGADVAVGSRFLAGKPPRTSLARRIGSRLFAWIASRWTRTRVTDPTSGFQALRARAVAELAHDGFPEDYPDADVLIILSKAGMRVVEVPVVMRERGGGVSIHRGSRAAYYAYKMVLTLALLPWRRRSPYRAEQSSAPVNAQ